MDLGAVPYECGVKSLVHDGAVTRVIRMSMHCCLLLIWQNDVNVLGMWIFNFCLPYNYTPLFNLNRGFRCPGGIWRNCQCTLSSWSMIQGHTPRCSSSDTAAADSDELALSQGAACRKVGQAMSHWSCLEWKRSSDLLKKLKVLLRWEDCLVFFAVQLLSNKWSRDEMNTLLKRQGKETLRKKCWQIPYFEPSFKVKGSFNGNTLCYLFLPCKFLTCCLISVKCQSCRFQRY